MDPAHSSRPRYPLVAAHPFATDWLIQQGQVGLTARTLAAYGSALNDYLAFCRHADVAVVDAARRDILGYLGDMRQRPHHRAGPMLHLTSGAGLAYATMRQRLTVVRQFYGYLIDEGLRADSRNPVPAGRYVPGRLVVGRSERSLLRYQERLPRLPTDEEWLALLAAAANEPVRNRLMFVLAYGGALRRSEVAALEVRDLAVPYKQITVRPEIAKNGSGRVVMYDPSAQALLRCYLAERERAGIHGGVLFRSVSHRNHGAPMTAASWDTVVTRVACRAGLAHRVTTHTLRHLRLTDLARAGVDIGVIARYAGHRSIETTKLYIHLSGRESAETVRGQLHALDRCLERLVHQRDRGENS